MSIEQTLESIENTAQRIVDQRNLFKAQRDALLAAAEAALPQLEWANIHGSRSEELLSQVRAAIAAAKETP